MMFLGLRKLGNICCGHKMFLNKIKALANEDTLLRTHCCRHKCFPVCPRAQHLLRTLILCPGHRNVSDFVQKHFVSATNVSQFGPPKKHHGQQCVRNNVSSFTRTLRNTFCVPDTKFVSATNVARAGKRGNICVGNNVFATMCLRLPGPLHSFLLPFLS